MKAATKEHYFLENPVQDVKCKAGASTKLKENLEVAEYVKLLQAPCINEEVRDAFIVSCYQGLRWADVKPLLWRDIGTDTVNTRIIQAKTGEPVVLTLHAIVKETPDKRRCRFEGEATGKVFKLPTADGANKILSEWVKRAGINKRITWSCARLSFSILLQDERVDNATVALLLGHTTTKYVERTYKRHRPKDQKKAIDKLPNHVQKKEADFAGAKVIQMAFGGGHSATDQ